ncbi:MAG: alpha/beta fold hydrolase [Gemmatales bacterium]
MSKLLYVVVSLITFNLHLLAADPITPQFADFVIPEFQFNEGASFKELRLHYCTIGKPQRDAQGNINNAVLVMHGTTGSSSSLLRDEFVLELFAKGQPLDSSRFFIVIPDAIGHGKSSKPSDGLHAKFPHYGYEDMVRAQHLLLKDGLKVHHLRLVMGTSMGGMHTWLWGQRYPDFMDALLPLASLPTQISGRNRVWRRLICDAIRNDPTWMNGEYGKQPQSLRTVAQMMFLVGSNPVIRQQEAPTRKEADKQIDQYIANAMRTMDANDVLYAVESSSDYDPAPGLEKIKAPLLAINFADDLINPPELGVLEKEVKRLPRGKAVVVPFSKDSRGHGTHTIAAVWKHYLVELLKESAR